MGDTYVNIFLNSAIAEGSPTAALTLLLLFLARILPIISLAPFFGSRVLPHPVKVTFGISLFVIFLPHLLVVTKTAVEYNTFAILLFAKELFVGFVLGFMVSIPFTIAQSAGMLVDHQRGGASLMVNDPTIQNQSSPIGTLLNLVLIYLFFAIDAPFLFIDAILTSYELIPPDQFVNPQIFNPDSDFVAMLIPLLNKAMKIAAQLATPALMAILMTDVFLGIANRLAPQVQITFLGLPLKSLMGLTVICIGWKALTNQMVIESYSWLHFIEEMLILFKP